MSKLKRVSRGLVLAAGVVVAGSGGMAAQTTPTANGMPAVPTTKVLAIGHVVDGVATEKLMPVMKSEVPETLKLYLAGKIDQWYVMQNKRGVVFVMNVTTVEEAHTLLEKLPLGQAKMMEFDLIPLGPLSPLYRLLGAPAAASATK